MNLLRTDLVRRHWRLYLLICAAVLAVHALWLRRIGIAPSTDFGIRYDPGARQLLAALGVRGFGDAPSIGTYGWSRIGYVSFVAAAYALFGVSLGAAVYPQVAVVWLVYPLAFHTLVHITRRPLLAFGAMCVWLTYYDGYQWHFWALPDALYRLIFLSSFFVLVRLWELGRRGAFVGVLFVAVAVGTVFRIETPLYAIPGFWLAGRFVYRRYPMLLWAGLAVFVAALWVARGAIHDLFIVFVSLQARGFVLPGSGMNVPGVTELAPPTGDSVRTWMLFFGHLGLARLWYAVTPLPALWSLSHRLNYALYISIAYVLAGFGLVSAFRRNDYMFLVCFWIFIAGDLLEMVVAIDPSMRYVYTPQMFLFFCAAMGWPALMSKVRPQWA